MDATTLFLAQLIGPSALAVGLGIFFSRNYYLDAYRHLEKETLGVLMSGLLALVVGIVIVRVHNVWDTPLAAVVTFVGWGSIVKGFLLIVVPRYVDRIGEYLAHGTWLSYIGVLYVVVGVYVSYLAYLA
ncbi:MAG: hypothetical protein KBC21_04485 [Candidatus Pacebacteria bacterium]|nr:hypothetical protein [Candidatus Paceibacterota bacterium]